MTRYVRINEEENVIEKLGIYKKQIWWLVIYFENNELKYTYFKSTISELVSLKNFVKNLNEKKIPFLVFAIWYDSYRTDAFLFRPEYIDKVPL